MSSGKIYDLKVGYSCNNNCIHCVIRPNIMDIHRKGYSKIDSNYNEIIECINSKEFSEAETITITGGEPTLRREFMRIMKYIVAKYPNKKINLQTNGRLLSKYLEELHSLSNNIGFVIALHSIDEKVHNLVVGNKNEKGNPFNETMDTLNKIKEIYGQFKNVARIEIVLSSINYKSIVETVKALHEMDIDRIGISYPHLDGFYGEGGAEMVRDIGLSYEELKTVLPGLYNYSKENQDLIIEIEEVPICMFRDYSGNILAPIKNINAMVMGGGEVSVKFPEREVENDFRTIWLNIHKKSNKCGECVFNERCCGVWFEAIDTYGDVGFTPITQEEASKGGLVRCSY